MDDVVEMHALLGELAACDGMQELEVVTGLDEEEALAVWQEVCDIVLDVLETLEPAEVIAGLETVLRATPDDAVGRAEVLCAAAEVTAENAGDGEQARSALARALELYRAALDHGAPTVRDPRVGVVEVLLRLGDDTADAELTTLRRDREFVDSPAAHDLAGVLEHLGQLDRAARWFTLRLRDVDPTVVHHLEDLHESEVHDLAGRFRVRRAADKPEDGLDRLYARLEPDNAAWMRTGVPPALD